MTVLRTSLRNVVAHKGRMLLSGVAVVLSVAFVCGTLVFTDTMNTTFDRLFSETAADVTVSSREAENDEVPDTGKPATVPASLVDELEGVEGVASVSGGAFSTSVTVVNEDDENVGSTTGAPTIASNWSDVDERSMEVTSGRLPRGEGEAVIDADTAEKHGLELGDELRTISALGDFRSEIVGVAAFRSTNPGATVVYFDTETVQTRLLGDSDAYTSVYVTAAEGVGDGELKRNVVAALGADGYKVQTQEEYAAESQEDLGAFLDVIKYALLGFAGIALLVGVFLIVNTFSMLVAQRTREIGLLRAIGSSRRQVNRSVLVEALLLGLLGSVLGVGAGVGLAVGLMELMGLVGMNLSTDDLTVRWTTPVVGVALGVVVTVLAAYLPARRAGRISPMAALRDDGLPAAGSRVGRVRSTVGAVLSLAGAGALVVAAGSGEASTGSAFLGLGVVLTLVGFVLVGPLLAAFLVRVLGAVVLRVFGPVGRMAERNALRNPRRTGATGAALMIGLALVASLSVVGASLVASASDELDRTVGADFIVQSDTYQPIVPEAVERLRSTEGVEHVTEYRMLEARLSPPDGGSVARAVTAASPTYASDLRVETVSGELADAYGRDAMSVPEDFADRHGVEVGDRIEVDFERGGTAALTVRAITAADTSVDQGAMYLSTATAERYVAEDRMPLNMIVFAKAEDGREDAAYAALKSELEPFPQYTVRNQADYKELLEDQVGQLLNMVYGLLALAIVVAILGVVNTLALSVVERTREIGLMRAIGLSRRQLRRMIRLESVVIALFGAVLGLGLGLGWGVAAQRLLALEGLKVLQVPWSTIAVVFVGAALVGLVAALVPAFRAGRMNVLNAIATE
ncbi:FtsX-like permease family protein [Streptomyces sp. TRM43335]|uniref:FtsX-like permease family protein n=1 Tax=Streptomyces taklimakanensis TaxID=2569853 RepID=A0A6G2BB81_9ACTN|nr:ABC transporter permease [Streptomyces taklimakanensis]MTE19386.1 FtsX-like permease family protein [Streptomyces taklimakanensis]